MKRTLFILLVAFVLIPSCKKKDTDPLTTPPLVFDNITFNRGEAYFSTNGSMAAPVDSNEAKTMISKIDLTFFYNYDYSEPGFFDPVARAASDTAYWSDYALSWLANGMETRFYGTALTKSDFVEAKKNQSLIAVYFADASSMKLAPHSVWPTGSSIGGRQTYSPESYVLRKSDVYGFENVSTGKKGLIYIRTDQAQAWPIPFFSFDTKVDIIREK